LIAIGLIAHEAELCPAVKRIWTPSWTLYSGGWCFLLLAGFYLLIDIPNWTSWSYPLRVIGMNSIAAYVLAHGFDRYVAKALQTHLGPQALAPLMKGIGLGGFHQWLVATLAPYEPLVLGLGVLLVLWLILWWMERRKLYLKI